MAQQLLRLSEIGEVALGAELGEDLRCLVKVPIGERSRSAACNQPAQSELAECRLITFAEEVEQRDALGEVVVRVRCGAALLLERASQPQVLTPRSREDPGIQGLRDGGQSALGVVEVSGGGERLGGDESCLECIEGRGPRGENPVRQPDRVVQSAARPEAIIARIPL